MTPQHCRLAIVGDVMLGRLVNDFYGTRPPAWFWGTALPVLQRADAVLANLECAITASRTRWARYPKVFHFRAEPAAVEVLQAASIDCVSLANNHVLDAEIQGLKDTLDHLDRGGIRHAGAGLDLAAARAPVLLAAGGLKIGLLSVTDNEPGFAAAENSPGTFYGRLGEDEAIAAQLESLAAGLRRDGADLVVLAAHWGPNVVTEPPPHFQAFARRLVDGGAVDLFWGHSAHVFQGVEPRRGGLILYDTGDFLDDYAVDPWLRNDWSFIFQVDLAERRIARLTLIPVVLTLAQVNLAEGAVAAEICARMQAAAARLGTRLLPSAEGLEWLPVT